MEFAIDRIPGSTPISKLSIIGQDCRAGRIEEAIGAIEDFGFH